MIEYWANIGSLPANASSFDYLFGNDMNDAEFISFQLNLLRENWIGH
jgi:hypothetical protein